MIPKYRIYIEYVNAIIQDIIKISRIIIYFLKPSFYFWHKASNQLVKVVLALNIPIKHILIFSFTKYAGMQSLKHI